MNTAFHELSRFVIAILLVAAGLFLVRDATTYALSPEDPANGRHYGCFTKLDLLLGVGPSEGGIFRGTRLVELVAGIPAVILGLVYFFRNFWRSRVEVPLLWITAAYGLWHLGRAAFWAFHDADVFLTWRIIGNTSNVLAERVSGAMIFVFGIAAFVVAYRIQRRRKRVSLRLLAYAAAIMTILAIPSLRFMKFPSAWFVVAIALIVPLIPLLLARQRLTRPYVQGL